jgi:hypothetical protein
MEPNLPPDHETELRRRFDERRQLFVELAHDPAFSVTAGQLLAQARHTEALIRLRERWQLTRDVE